MDIREQLEQAKSPEEMEEYMLDLDSEFRFKCRRCGKCCKNQDTILFNARDIYNIAKKLGKTTIQVIEECAEVYGLYRKFFPTSHGTYGASWASKTLPAAAG